MELWIRSQDKTMLCKPQYIELHGESEVHFGDINIGYRCVASYKSKQRALEVLDEIQKYLTPTIQMLDETIGNKEVCQIGTIMTIVYEMPQE